MLRSILCFLLLGVVGAGCNGGSEPTPTRSRVDVVLTEDGGGIKLDAFCEVVAEPSNAKSITWPEMEGESAAVESGWAWYSLWATWCGPCIEEVPMMRRWEEKLAGEGVEFAIRHVSVDASAEDLSAYRAKHADAPSGPRVVDQAAVGPWLTSLGLDEGAAIPIHLFVNPDQKIRCVRVGAVSEHDYRTVKQILQGG